MLVSFFPPKVYITGFAVCQSFQNRKECNLNLIQRKLELIGLFAFIVGLALSANAQAPAVPTSSPAKANKVVPSATAVLQSIPPDTVVISIGDIKVTAKEVNRILETMPAQFRPFYSGPGKRQLADIIINNKLLFQEAEGRKLQDKDPVNLDIRISREAILTAAARGELEKEIAVTDEAMQKYLDENMAKYEQAKVRRIVICSTAGLNINPNQPAGSCLPPEEARAKAEEIRKKLLSGADFEEMAAKFSSDTMSSGKGGDLGYIRRGHQMPLIVPPVEEAVFSIPVGSISEVIPSAFGFEIVKVEDRRKPKVQEVRRELEPQLRKQKVDDLLKDWKAKQTVTIDEGFFAPRQMVPTAPTKH
jgi:parvulin-like peptidyl-prolyl isomerase